MHFYSYFFWKWLSGGTVPPDNSLSGGTVPPDNSLSGGTVSEGFLRIICYPEEPLIYCIVFKSDVIIVIQNLLYIGTPVLAMT